MSIVHRKWEDLTPCPYVLGANNSRDRYYKRCPRHNKILVDHGFESNPPAIIVSPSECDYCKLETSLKRHGQLKEVLLYNDGKTIRGPDGNHRSITLGLLLNRSIACIITDEQVPTNKLEWITGISQDDLTKQTDFETIVNWIEELYDDTDVDIIAETLFAYRVNAGIECNIEDVKFIHDEIIPFYQKYPEFRNRIGRPGEYIYGNRTKRVDDRIFFCYGKIKEIIKRNLSYEINEISKILKETDTGKKSSFRNKDHRIDKIKKQISKTKKLPPYDPIKIETLRMLVEDNTIPRNPNSLRALDLFARKMDAESTTGIFLDNGYKVIAIGNEVDRFMTQTEKLLPIETDVYTYLYEHNEYLGKYDWINIDPFGEFSTKIIHDLIKITPNLTWFMSQWKLRRSNKNYLITAKNHLEEFGLHPPKDFETYLSNIEKTLDDNYCEVKQYPLRNGNIMMYIKNTEIIESIASARKHSNTIVGNRNWPSILRARQEGS